MPTAICAWAIGDCLRSNVAPQFVSSAAAIVGIEMRHSKVEGIFALRFGGDNRNRWGIGSCPEQGNERNFSRKTVALTREPLKQT